MMFQNSSVLVLNFWSMLGAIYLMGDQSGCSQLLIAVDSEVRAVHPAHFAAVLATAWVAVEAHHLEGLRARCC
jgi:hypothetical protein